jgi:hypothetical protein
MSRCNCCSLCSVLGYSRTSALAMLPNCSLRMEPASRTLSLGEIDEDVGLGVRRSQIKAAHISVLEFKLPSIGLRRQHQRHLRIGGLVLPNGFYRAFPVIFEVLGGDTGQLVGMHFCHAESTFEYMNVTRRYLLEYGKSLAFYSDKHAVFRVNKAGGTRGEGITQFVTGTHAHVT